MPTRDSISAPADSGAPAALQSALAALNRSELVVFPTETFYGLGANALDAVALRRLFALKRREPDKPVGLIAADLAMVDSVAREFPAPARRLAERFWPGPLTLVLPARTELAPELLNGEGGVAVRISPHPIAHALTLRLGHPLTATSANLAGAPPATTVAQARVVFAEQIAIYLDGGEAAGGLPSTVVAFSQGRPLILRAGAISERELLETL